MGCGHDAVLELETLIICITSGYFLSLLSSVCVKGQFTHSYFTDPRLIAYHGHDHNATHFIIERKVCMGNISSQQGGAMCIIR